MENIASSLRSNFEDFMKKKHLGVISTNTENAASNKITRNIFDILSQASDSLPETELYNNQLFKYTDALNTIIYNSPEYQYFKLTPDDLKDVSLKKLWNITKKKKLFSKMKEKTSSNGTIFQHNLKGLLDLFYKMSGEREELGSLQQELEVAYSKINGINDYMDTIMFNVFCEKFVPKLEDAIDKIVE